MACCLFHFPQEELLFYNDDGSPQGAQSVLVERNLRAADLCSVLAVKNRVAKDVHWTLFEHWPELGLGEFHRLSLSVLNIHVVNVLKMDHRKLEELKSGERRPGA